MRSWGKRNPSPVRDAHYRRLAGLLYRYVVRTLRRGSASDLSYFESGRGTPYFTITFDKILFDWVYHGSHTLPFRIGFGPMRDLGQMIKDSGMIVIKLPEDRTIGYEDWFERGDAARAYRGLAGYLEIPQVKKTFIHETIHLIDNARRVHMDASDTVFGKAYFNQPHEMNAHAQDTMYRLEAYMKKRQWTLPEVIHSFKHMFGVSEPGRIPEIDLPFYKLTLQNQRRMLKRVALFWKHFYGS